MEAGNSCGGLRRIPLIVGGRSMGGRIASQVVAKGTW